MAKGTKHVKKLTKILGGAVEDPGCNFANGDGFYQLTPEAVRMFDNAFIEAVKELHPDLFNAYASKGLPFVILNYFTGRSLDDMNSPLYGVHGMRMCVDDKFRRWGQPYYALNPAAGEQKKLGDLK